MVCTTLCRADRASGRARRIPSRCPTCCPSRTPRSYESSAAAFGPAEGLEELCDALRRRLAGELHVREHLLQAARAYVRQHGPNIDQAALVEALEARRARIPDPGRGCSLRRR